MTPTGPFFSWDWACFSLGPEKPLNFLPRLPFNGPVVYYLPLMARRPTKLEFHEHRVTSPYCRTAVTVFSLMEFIIAACKDLPGLQARC